MRLLITAKHGVHWVQPLTVFDGGEEVLSVFRFEEEAGMFVWLQVSSNRSGPALVTRA